MVWIVIYLFFTLAAAAVAPLAVLFMAEELAAQRRRWGLYAAGYALAAGLSVWAGIDAGRGFVREVTAREAPDAVSAAIAGRLEGLAAKGGRDAT